MENSNISMRMSSAVSKDIFMSPSDPFVSHKEGQL